MEAPRLKTEGYMIFTPKLQGGRPILQRGLSCAAVTSRQMSRLVHLKRRALSLEVVAFACWQVRLLQVSPRLAVEAVASRFHETAFL